MNYAGKVVVITGAGSGIGAELARQLSAAGAKVVLAGRRVAKLEEVARSCRGDTRIVRTDVAQHADLENLITQARTHFQRIDVVVSNAGLSYGGALTELTPEEIEYSTRVNFTAPLQLVRLALPQLERGAQIVIVSSIAPYAPLPFHALYTGQKGGLQNACKSLSQELRPAGIHVCCVMPGTVWSEIVNEEFHRALVAQGVPVKPMATTRAVQRMLRGMQRERDEVHVWARSEYVLAFLYRVAPRLVERMMAPNAPAFHDVMKRVMAAHRE